MMHMNFNHTIVFFDSNQAKYIEKLKLRFCFGIIVGILHKDNKYLNPILYNNLQSDNNKENGILLIWVPLIVLGSNK